jgi:hypothetical protein
MVGPAPAATATPRGTTLTTEDDMVMVILRAEVG